MESDIGIKLQIAWKPYQLWEILGSFSVSYAALRKRRNLHLARFMTVMTISVRDAN